MGADILAGINTTLGLLTSGIELVKSLGGLKNDKEKNEKNLQLQKLLSDAMSEVLDAKRDLQNLFEDNQSLSKELIELKDLRKNYEMVNPFQDTRVYKMKASAEGSAAEKQAYYCPNCFNKEDKAIPLQGERCTACQSTFQLSASDASAAIEKRQEYDPLDTYGRLK